MNGQLLPPVQHHLERLRVPVEPRPLLRSLLWSWPMIPLPDYPRDHLTICMHEAGHIVLARLQNMRPAMAFVKSNLDGRVEFDEHIHADGSMRLRARADEPIVRCEQTEGAAVEIAAMYFSGVVAELLHHGLQVDGWIGLETPDWHHARTVLCLGFGHDLPRYFCQQLARAVLSEHWPVVQDLAEAMTNQGELGAGDIERICADRLPICTATHRPLIDGLRY